MRDNLNDREQDRFLGRLSSLWKDEQDQILISRAIQALDTRYHLSRKVAAEPGVEGIIGQMLGRLASSFGRLSSIQNKKILDIACGSNSSKAPGSFHVDMPFGARKIGRSRKGYTALFEPWFCRILIELGASPVGIDSGDLEHETFTHYHVDLGQPGALDFLPSHSFDAIQDSRLFGSPEFTAQFPSHAARSEVAQEIRRQEQRLLKRDGLIIHSDATALLNSMGLS